MTKWTNADLKRLGVIEKQIKAKKPKLPKADPVGLAHIKATLVLAGINFTPELKFHPLRKWRFDLAIPERRIAIEYEGTNSRKSRHTTITGYSEDCEKYNEAVKHGWQVLRYTALNYKKVSEDVIQLMST